MGVLLDRGYWCAASSSQPQADDPALGAIQGEGDSAPSCSRSRSSTTVIRICPWRSSLRAGCRPATRGSLGSAAATAQHPTGAGRPHSQRLPLRA